MKRLTVLAAALIASPLALAMPPHAGGMPDIGEMFLKQFDADKDGKVTRDEFLASREAQFDRIDSNGDGTVDQSELEVLKTELMQHMQQHGGGPR